VMYGSSPLTGAMSPGYPGRAGRAVFARLQAAVGGGLAAGHWARRAGPGAMEIGLAMAGRSGRQELSLPVCKSCTVASIVSRRAGQAVSQLARGPGGHHIRTVPAQGA